MEISNEITVLLAEHHRLVSQALEHLLHEHANARVAAAAEDADGALALGVRLDPDVAIVDLELSPNCSLVSRFRDFCPRTRVIVLADRQTTDTTVLVNALASGAVGALYKDSSIDELARALGSSATSPVLPGEAVGLLLGSYLDSVAEKRQRDLATIASLTSALEAKDLTTGHHVARVPDLALAGLRRIDSMLAQNEEVRYGFLLHDVGKIGIPDHILGKPGPLDEAEWEVMRGHPELGVKILQPARLSNKATDIVLWHHERWDGNGYPHGLRGEEIPLSARVFSVADAFDAMTSDRPYRPALSANEARGELIAGRGTAFDPDIVDVFLELPEVTSA